MVLFPSLLEMCVCGINFANFLHKSMSCLFIYFSLKYIAQIWSDFRCYPWCNPGGLKLNGLGPSCSPECFQYRGTMDVFSKISRQVNTLAEVFFFTVLFRFGLIIICYDLCTPTGRNL
jgi:hypothetical protein